MHFLQRARCLVWVQETRSRTRGSTRQGTGTASEPDCGGGAGAALGHRLPVQVALCEGTSPAEPQETEIEPGPGRAGGLKDESTPALAGRVG